MWDQTFGSSPYRIVASLRPTDAAGGEGVPSMPRQYPLDLILLASLNPAISQMVGLYWIDQDTKDGVTYDYLILGDYVNRFDGKVDNALDQEQLKQTIGTVTSKASTDISSSTRKRNDQNHSMLLKTYVSTHFQA